MLKREMMYENEMNSAQIIGDTTQVGADAVVEVRVFNFF